MFQLFVNREEELKILENRFRTKRPEFMIIYGRRRVGKTELVTHLIRNRPNVYFLAEEKTNEENMKEMQNVMSGFLSDDEFKRMEFNNWVVLFQSFLKRIKKRVIIVIDEFPYLVKQNKAVASEFQKIWDMYLSKSNAMLILVGSSIAMMEKLMGKKSPLYGRRTGQLEIKSIDVFGIKGFLPRYSMEELTRVYACVDGIPIYLNQFNDKLSFFDNLANAFLRKDAILYSEAEFLLKQEFRESARYFSILKAIAFGNTRHNEIVNYTNLEKTVISKYIQNLEKIRVIKRGYPVTDRKEKRKNARYGFSDNYFKFWFRFIYPNKTLIEIGETNEVLDVVKQKYNRYLGVVFEEVAKEFLWRTRPFKFTKIGRWWHKDNEIDVVALNDETKEIVFAECKWKTKINAEKVAKALVEKVDCVDWDNEKRKDSFAVFAKSFRKRINEFEGKRVYCFDLKDLENTVWK